MGWGLGHTIIIFLDNDAFKKNNQLPNLMISVCKTCSTLFLHCKLLSVFHKHHCIGITFTYRKSSVSPNGGGEAYLIWALRNGRLTEMGGGGGGGLISINTKFNFLREQQISYVSAMSFIP